MGTSLLDSWLSQQNYLSFGITLTWCRQFQISLAISTDTYYNQTTTNLVASSQTTTGMDAFQSDYNRPGFFSPDRNTAGLVAFQGTISDLVASSQTTTSLNAVQSDYNRPGCFSPDHNTAGLVAFQQNISNLVASSQTTTGMNGFQSDYTDLVASHQITTLLAWLHSSGL